MDPVIFSAYFPEKAGAISLHGQEGARITLDLPDTEIAAAARLILLRNKALRVTIEVLDG